MEKANYTFRFFEKCLSMLLLATAFIFSPAIVNACEMSCGASQQVSFGANCEAVITPNMILTDDGASCEGATLTVAAKYTMNGPSFISGATIPLGDSLINREIFIEVISENDGVINRCWGTIVLEDKLEPSMECNDITVSCSNDAFIAPALSVSECGDDPTFTFSQEPDVLSDSEDTIKTYIQTIIATDEQGNFSSCERTVAVLRLDLEGIDFPANLMVSTNNALACDSAYAKIEAGSIIPAPSFSGVPKLGNAELYPNKNFDCRVEVSYTDQVVPQAANQCTTKILRTWVITEWIGAMDVIRDSVQIIQVVDAVGPVITTDLVDVVVTTTTGMNCEALYILPQIDAEDNCKEVDVISISYPGGFIEDYDGSEMITLAEGANRIIVTAYDACSNATLDTFMVTVEDSNAPVAVCDQNTVVALSSSPNGLTSVAAITFDDGSYDECQLASPAMSVKRMDDGAGCGIDGSEFSSHVQFCCSDSSPVIVIFQVTDSKGNSNTCMVNVEVQSKLPPTVTAPASVTVECFTPYELTVDGLVAAFGDVTVEGHCGNDVNYNITRSFSGGQGACSTGTLVRTFIVNDGNGGLIERKQSIKFENRDPFDPETIEWPSDVTVNECLPLTMGMSTKQFAELSPTVTGEPVVTKSACDWVSNYKYDDLVFEILNSSGASCLKIIRKFSISEECADTSYLYQQVIMVVNNVAPEFELATDPIVECTAEDECANSMVILRMAASDDCTPASDLAWQYAIDVDNNGSIDITSPVSAGSSTDSLNGGLASIFDATGSYPVGSHRIIWSVADGCGNLTRVEQLFTVEICALPSPYAYDGLAIVLAPIYDDNNDLLPGGSVDIWASDFDAGSAHSCISDVTVSFSADPTDTGRTYTCDSIGERAVQIWASVELADGTLAQNFTTSYVDIQDNKGICTGISEEEEEEQIALALSGTISTESDQLIEQVQVEVLNMDMVSEITDEDGYYLFDDMKNGGTYQMHPALNTGHLNGVTTLDLVLIQRHILGLTKFDSPYKVIAADINRDGNVSAKDLLLLRKSILGIVQGFPGNESWRFVDRAYSFIDPVDPLSEKFRETYDVNNMKANMNIDFVGMKTGDVNGSVVANASPNASVRNSSTLDFVISNQSAEAGSVLEIPVFAENFNEIIAYQYSIELTADLEFVSVRPGALSLNTSNFGTSRVDDGLVTTSWDNYQGRTIAEDEPLFFITVNVLSDVRISDAIDFNSSVTKAEAYSIDQNMDINLESRNIPESTGVFKLYQNTPNPFQGRTNIQFEVGSNVSATLSLFDVTGKLMKSISGDYEKGLNSIELDVQDLGVNGVLYYTLRTENHTATKKMVVIK